MRPKSDFKSRISFSLTPLPPFRLDLTAWTLRRRPDNAVDRWDGTAYRRALQLTTGPVEVGVTQFGPPEAPKLRVVLGGNALRSQAKAEVSSALRRLLGLDMDMQAFYQFAKGEGPLEDVACRFKGMKPPRFATVFECLVNAIACQQLTLTVGVRLLNRLAEAYGAAVHVGNATAYAFPHPEDLVEASPAALRKLGFTQQKGRAIIEIARSVTEGDLDLEGLDALPDDAALICLQNLRGVGRWSAEYVLLRGLGRLNIFPGDDVGARNYLQKWLHLLGPLDYEGVGRALERWKRFGGLVYLHLLLGRLAETGCLKAEGILPGDSASDLPVIWTIGHSTRTIEEFIDLLRQNGIETLVDVRHFPGSRRFPHFGKAALDHTLATAGIGYQHVVELGGRRPPRSDSRNHAWRNAAFRGYADYMETQPFRKGVDRLLDIARGSRTAVMCSEAVWWRCHRSMIADYLKSRGVRVIHILGSNKLQEHPYTSAARLIGGALTYESPPLTPHTNPLEDVPMKHSFKVGDHVEWNSEAGRVRGTIKKKINSKIKFKGYTVHASKEEPQYLIESEKTDHMAMHKGSALKKLKKVKKRKS